MPRTWTEPEGIIPPDSYVDAIGGHPLVAQTLYRRGLTEINSAKAFIDPKLYHPSSPSELPDLDLAVNRLIKAIHKQEKICVWGDFDVDGQTATALLVSALQGFGANVIYHIPVRAVESHGINVSILDKYLITGIDLLLTCDTGISAIDAVEKARSYGVDVIITDHHDIPTSLPESFAIINPKRLPLGHSLATLPGVGVAYKVIEQLNRVMNITEDTTQYLDLVALGIVSDLAYLVGDTRYLLQEGLKILRMAKRAGLHALLDLVELLPDNITEEHIGFIIGPRLNAMGRLADANLCVDFLTTEDKARAQIIAQELEMVNSQRKLLTTQVFQAALSQIDKEPALRDEPAMILYHPTWPAGIIGIVASRLVEQYHRPVILLSGGLGESARGSARSIPGINITEAIAQNQDLLSGFGGHPMAAGLSISPERIPEFRRRFSHTIAEMSSSSPPDTRLNIDAYLSLADVNMDLIAEFERLAPFGSGNPPFILATRNLIIHSSSAVGQNDEHLIVTVEDELGNTQKMIWWQGSGWEQPEGLFDLAYTARSSTYRGERDIQFEWIDFRQLLPAPYSVRQQGFSFEVVDFRSESHPEAILEYLSMQQTIMIWCEDELKNQLSAQDRRNLSKADHFAIWTIPPGSAELIDALAKVNPKTIYLFSVDPGTDHPEHFLRKLTGLVKHVLNEKRGMANIYELSALTSQRRICVEAGLDWLATYGYINILDKNTEYIHIGKGNGIKRETTEPATIRLRALLNESAAYRSYYTRTDKDKLISPYMAGINLKKS